MLRKRALEDRCSSLTLAGPRAFALSSQFAVARPPHRRSQHKARAKEPCLRAALANAYALCELPPLTLGLDVTCCQLLAPKLIGPSARRALYALGAECLQHRALRSLLCAAEESKFDGDLVVLASEQRRDAASGAKSRRPSRGATKHAYIWCGATQLAQRVAGAMRRSGAARVIITRARCPHQRRTTHVVLKATQHVAGLRVTTSAREFGRVVAQAQKVCSRCLAPR